MERIPEPELMEGEEQALAYAQADFTEPHSRFIALFQETFGRSGIQGYVLDLGCGPGDISFRFARAYPECVVHGVDGSAAMLDCGKRLLGDAPALEGRVVFINGILPEAVLPRERYDVIISNSLLHHLKDPLVLWDAVKRYAAQGIPIFIMDLKRPATPEEARAIVETYSREEPEVLKKDFYHSLLASYTIEEIREQLIPAGLGHLDVRAVSDRHVLVSGRK